MLKNEKTALFLPNLLYLKYFVSVSWVLDDHAWERIEKKAACVCFFKRITEKRDLINIYTYCVV